MKRHSNSQMVMTEKGGTAKVVANNWRAKKLMNASSIFDNEKSKLSMKAKLAASYQSPYRKARVLRQNQSQVVYMSEMLKDAGHQLDQKKQEAELFGALYYS